MSGNPWGRRQVNDHRAWPEAVSEERRIIATVLSRRPREYSAQVAMISFLAMLWVSLLCWRQGAQFAGRLASNSQKILLEGEYWRLWTGMAVHADATHFAFNAVLFVLLSYLLYGYFGFWVYPAWSLALGGVTTYFSLLTYPPATQLIGASGLVYLMGAFWLAMYVLVERRLSLKRRLLHATGMALIVFLPTSLQPGISYRTHAIGFAMGTVMALLWFWMRKERFRSAEVFEAAESKTTESTVIH